MSIHYQEFSPTQPVISPPVLAAQEGDSKDLLAAKQLTMAGGHYGGCMVPVGTAYRGTTGAGWPAVPTLALAVDDTTVLSAVAYAANAPWQTGQGVALTALTLAPGIHFLSLTSFTVDSGALVETYLAAPWTAQQL